LKKTQPSRLQLDSSRVFSLFNKFKPAFESAFFNKIASYPGVLQLFNDDSDKNKIKYPLYKAFNLPFKNISLLNAESSFQLDSFTDLNLFNLSLNASVFENSATNKTFIPFSSNQSFSLVNKSLREFSSISPSISSFNSSSNLNTVSSYLSYANADLHSSPFFFSNVANTK
jgi:hypothetical protein